MTPIDTAALRARPAHYNRANDPGVVIVYDYERDALCDAYDEAARLREGYGAVSARTSELTVEASRLRTEARRIEAEVVKWTEDAVAARQALAALAADLRALCAIPLAEVGRVSVVDLRAVIDRHAPATPTTED